MFPSEKEYGEMTKRLSPPSSKLKDFIWAYAVGGLICVIGQLFKEWFTALDMPEKVVKAAIPSLLIFIAAWLTGLKLFDKIAKHAGAGTLVPDNRLCKCHGLTCHRVQKRGLCFRAGR